MLIPAAGTTAAKRWGAVYTPRVARTFPPLLAMRGLGCCGDEMNDPTDRLAGLRGLDENGNGVWVDVALLGLAAAAFVSLFSMGPAMSGKGRRATR